MLSGSLSLQHHRLISVFIFGVLTLVIASPSKSQQPSASVDTSNKFDARAFIRDTESILRPARSEETVVFLTELESRGQKEAVRALRASLSTSADDYRRLTTFALRQGYFPTADAILRDWQNRFPKQSEPSVLLAVSLFAQGNIELAQRELSSVSLSPTSADADLLAVLKALVRAKQLGKDVDANNNPWNIRFVADADKYAAGKIAEAEKAKIPPYLVPGLGRLLTITPLQGSLWYLMGELLNAQGDTAGALECFRRAEILLFTPKIMIEHRRVLELHRKQAQQVLEEQLAKTAANSPTDANAPEFLYGKTQVAIVMAIGSLIVLAIMILQVREWLKPKRRK